ncbi:uncharacterized protein LOC111279115 [Durio zibethinus]|uniref:Uncharacterized protein LOC111279115 n=1 Tax=Durio zibethinus TaxID=66656 RepID=A0A6P5X099_DURZI|nr:uncharacterized protein LOC111279115 [Durio zibethinus]
MDWMAPRDKDLELHLENGVTVSEEEDYSRSHVLGLKKKALLLLAKVKGSFSEGSDDRVSLSGDDSNSGWLYVENVQAETSLNIEGEDCKDAKENKLVKEKRKSLSNKKPPKPPRPPRAPSLDAADQKLIRELAELARLKRARIERMKALKKMKAAKGTSSNSNMFAMVFTVIFCLVIIFQGMPSRGTPTSIQGSPVPAGAVEGGLISVQFSGNPSASIRNRPDSRSPYLVAQVAGLDAKEKPAQQLTWSDCVVTCGIMLMFLYPLSFRVSDDAIAYPFLFTKYNLRASLVNVSTMKSACCLRPMQMFF